MYWAAPNCTQSQFLHNLFQKKNVKFYPKVQTNKWFHRLYICVRQSDNEDQLWGNERLCEAVQQDEERMEDGQDRAHRHPAVRRLLGPVLLCGPHCICWVGVCVCVCVVALCQQTFCFSFSL